MPYFSILCPENIGSAKKLSLACQEEFGVGAPSFLQAGIGERKKANQVSSRQALEEKKQEYLWLDSWQYLHSTNVSGYRYMSVQSKDLGAVFFGNANTCRNDTICITDRNPTCLYKKKIVCIRLVPRNEIRTTSTGTLLPRYNYTGYNLYPGYNCQEYKCTIVPVFIQLYSTVGSTQFYNCTGNKLITSQTS